MADRICRAIAADDATSLVVAGLVSTLADGREFVKRRMPDLIVVDLRVADGPVARWVDQFPSGGRVRPRFVVLARALHDPELLDALRSGADGYSLASHAPEQLIDVLEEVLGGRSTMAPEIARRLQMHFAQHEAAGAPLIDATDRQLLQWVSTGYGLDDIAQGMHTTPGHLGVQVRALYRKLQPDQPVQPKPPRRPR
jgi:two-component system nitrate/nitrite response regulator NarL